MKKILAFAFSIAFVFCLAFGATKHHSAAIKAAPAMAVLGAVAGAGNDRGIYEATVAKYGQGGGVIAPSYLRAEAYLQNGSQEYAFNLKVLGNEKPTERKLNDQDAFKISKVGLFLLSEDQAVDGVGVLQTYPNPTIFVAENGHVPGHLEHIYNGSLFLKVGDAAYLPDLPVIGCRVVNTTQKSGTNAYSERHPADGFINLTPQYVIKGNAANEIRLRVPGNSNQHVESGTAGFKNKVVLVFAGFRITGGATAQTTS